jgi:spermidine/putrescine ABC transporter ATP-binding subunit
VGKALELENVSKKFGDVIAVDKVSFSVENGEFFSLLGPSGCGKTTTLRLISGLEKCDEGLIKIDGAIMNDVPPFRRPTATVFQNWALFPHKNVYENVAFGLRMRKIPENEIKEKVKKYLEMVRLTGYEKRYPRQLSGGEQQRVALIRALIIEPKILLLDEPLSNLDRALRQEMRGEIRRIQRRLGITTIFVTHDQTEALSMSDRIGVMHSGRIIQIDTPEKIYTNPKTEFVAKFIGEANFFYGVVSSIHEKTATIETSDGLLFNFNLKNQCKLLKGTKIRAFIRPEYVKILEETNASRASNTFNGVIVDHEYFGSSIRHFIMLEGKTIIFVDDKKIRPKGNEVKVQLPSDYISYFIPEG